MMAADKLEELNNFEQSQCAKLLAQLAEKDKQLAAAVEDLKELADSTGDGCGYCKNLPCAQTHGKCIGFEWRGPQEAGEVEHEEL